MSFLLGFIGGGNMSTAIVQGILKNDLHPASKIWVSGPRLQNLTHFSNLGCNITSNNGDVYNKCEVIFLGVKPALLPAIAADFLNTLCITSIKKYLFVSMLAGITIEELHKALGRQKHVDIGMVRIMPNTPMAVGSGSCLYTPSEHITAGELALLERLLGGCGICERVPETILDPLAALTSCGPAFMYIIIEALADGAVKQGVPRDMALRHASQVMIGSGQMVKQTGKHPGLLKDEVCSPGGTTICGVTALENGKVRASIIAAIEASTKRTKEMGGGSNK